MLLVRVRVVLLVVVGGGGDDGGGTCIARCNQWVYCCRR